MERVRQPRIRHRDTNSPALAHTSAGSDPSDACTFLHFDLYTFANCVTYNHPHPHLNVNIYTGDTWNTNLNLYTPPNSDRDPGRHSNTTTDDRRYRTEQRGRGYHCDHDHCRFGIC